MSDMYEVQDLPVFQNRMFHDAESARACVRGNVVLARDLKTGLISNRDFKPELMHYDTNYQNEQAVSGVFRNHLDEVAGIFDRNLGGCSLIEVGCGKAYFLERLREKGYDVIGFDPTYEGTSSYVVRDYFRASYGRRAQGVVLRHVLEHVADPIGFLRLIRDANGGQGRIYVEVPCLDWICDNRAWFDVFYEHVNYFRLEDFHRMFGTIYSSGKLFGGQYIYVLADLSTIQEPVLSTPDAFRFPADFLASVDRCARKLRQEGESPVAIWGGASKGVTFALFMQRAGAAIDFVIDANPAKWGKFMAGSGLEIHPPHAVEGLLSKGSTIFVMNQNYFEEIRMATNDQFRYLAVTHEFV